MRQEIARESSRRTLHTKVTGISFSDIPGQSALFKQYLSDPRSLKSYYPNAVADPLEVRGFIRAVLDNYRTDRQALGDALARINSALRASEAAFANIERLRRDDVVAVVTGQQAGLFGGPLYTIYKALSAVKLADELSAAGMPAVPVFWMATEDHDLDEISKTFFSLSSGKPYAAVLPTAPHVTDSSVGQINIGDNIGTVIDGVFDVLSNTGFSADIRSHLGSAWKAGDSLGYAFGKTIANLLPEYGLIVLDPLDPDLKRLASPIYRAAVSRSDDMISAIMARNRELENAGYHSQVKIDEDHFPLFWHDDSGARTSLKKERDGSLRTKSKTRRFTRDELVRVADVDPQRLSPGVMLRPVVQDYLLPTGLYFGGAAEIAYFAQNSVVYEALGRPVTPIAHRQSFTVIEKKNSRTLEKLSLNFADFLAKPESVIMNWAESNLDPTLHGIFDAMEAGINVEMDRIVSALERIDPTLVRNASQRRLKMLYHVSAIRKKTLRALARKTDHAEDRIAQLFDSLMPNGGLQERSINVFSFINTYGPDFLRSVYDAIDLNDKRHRILEISNE